MKPDDCRPCGRTSRPRDREQWPHPSLHYLRTGPPRSPSTDSSTSARATRRRRGWSRRWRRWTAARRRPVSPRGWPQAPLSSSPRAGSHVLFHDDVYYDFRTIAKELMPRRGLSSSVVDMSDLGAVRSALKPETRLLWTETPSNPLLKIVDLAALSALARERGATSWTARSPRPTLQSPLALGADVVCTRPPSTWAGSVSEFRTGDERRTAGTRVT